MEKHTALLSIIDSFGQTRCKLHFLAEAITQILNEHLEPETCSGLAFTLNDILDNLRSHENDLTAILETFHEEKDMILSKEEERKFLADVVDSMSRGKRLYVN